MKSADVRRTFLKFFEEKGHQAVASSPLIPQNDPTLLFANAGMNQFKETFLGLEERSYKRAVSIQKCVRAGGKHNDLENVGFTARHHTFFEMLGNFSFGDYFKEDAIRFAWELLTERLGIPKDRLYVTVFETDDEAFDIWEKKIGVPKDRIFRLGEADNFWRMGDTGPCGPSSEIFFDHGEGEGGISDPYQGILSGEDRYREIWNLVFMQYFEKEPGVMEPLPRPSVDTGSGLERLSAALQGVSSNYETDCFMPLIRKASELSGIAYVSDKKELEKKPAVAEQTAAFRVLADHARATGFLIGDGVLPSNEGRGYVLRRIMRRAIRFGRKLSLETSLLGPMIEVLIQEMAEFYPELQQRKDIILRTVKEEEARFLQTLDQGTEILEQEIQRLKKEGSKEIPGATVFKLYDTFGFPLDLTRLIAREKGLDIDEQGFDVEMEKARSKARASWKGASEFQDELHIGELAKEVFDKHGPTPFLGYKQTHNSAKVLSLSTGKERRDLLGEGEQGLMITDQTSFYAEGGGQVGDQGHLSGEAGLKVEILDCQKKSEVFIHHILVKSGSLKTGAKVELYVHESERRQTACNHSATHLLNAALRQVLGDHVTQAGSLVDATRLRFDFTHSKALTAAEIEKIESLVNQEIGKGSAVVDQVMAHQEAIASGALALFGEKYGDEVRVIRMGEFSTELCGGTHVTNTAAIRAFKIVSEGGVSSGVRRIEAITSDRAIEYFTKITKENLAARSSAGLSLNWENLIQQDRPELPTVIETQKEQIKQLEKEIKQLRGSQVNVDALIEGALEFTSPQGSAKLVTADLELEDREVLSQLSDKLRDKIGRGVVIIVGQGEKTNPLIVNVSKDLTGSFKAGNILREIAEIMGGKGGGRPDFAQGAAPDRSKITDAFARAKSLVQG